MANDNDSHIHKSMEDEIEALKKLVKKLQKQMKQVLKALPAVPEEEEKPKRISGFQKPGPISAKLAEFLGVTPETEVARTQVTQRITQYVRENNLQNPSNKREFKLDDTLKKLITQETDSDGNLIPITFFNLQKYMTPHYPKVVKDRPKSAPVKKVTSTKAAVAPSEPVKEESSKSTGKVVKRVIKKQTAAKA